MIRTALLNLYKGILAWEASLFRNRYTKPVIAIVGSSGKTSTKEALATLVRKAYGHDCIITPKSLNTEYGVPLTLFGYQDNPKHSLGWLWVPIRGLFIAFFGRLPRCMVLELGAEYPGDISYLGHIVRPTHVLLINISEAHSQYLGDLAAIRREKTSILQFLEPDGVAVMNGDDPFMAELKLSPRQTKLLVRLHGRADYFMTGAKISLEGTEGVLHHDNRTQRIRIQRYGEHHMYSVLFMAALGDCLGIAPSDQLEAFKAIKPAPGRGMLLKAKKGAYILDESYNAASPDAVHFSLDLLHELPAKKRIAILGDMRELKDPDHWHKDIGHHAHEVADYIIGVGPLSKGYKPNEWFITSPEAIPSALSLLEPGAIILIKGSQNTIRLEKVVKALMLHPEQAEAVLVRQEKDWLKRP